VADDEDSLSVGEDEEAAPALFDRLSLPHKVLDGVYESLVYDEPIAEPLLRTFTRAISMNHQTPLDQQPAWQNTLLLYGPPGSGKSSLAQALAQRLAIRLSNIFPSTKLLQINAHNLFSRYFGETSKKIGELFRNILSMAGDDEQLLVVLLDEVESVASARDSVSQNEPADTTRVGAFAVPRVVY
jgi:SpoVK/Ycf46/Vps4 family AAA+-type ATPase